MLARDKWERLLGAIVDLYTGGGAEAGAESRVTMEPPASRTPPLAVLGAEEEALVMAGSDALLAITEGAAREVSADAAPSPFAIAAAIGGAEWAMREEILAGRTARLPLLFPDLAFLVTLPFLGHEEAMRRRRQAGELIGSGK